MNETADAGAFLSDYFGRLASATELTDALVQDLSDIAAAFRETTEAERQVMIIGNGGSMAIASHVAVDLTKNAGIPTTAFSDGALLTCLANDYGYERMFQHAIRLYGAPGDTLVAISSSGESPSIVNAAEKALARGIRVVTLSGMAESNTLRRMGWVNLWVDSRAYNIVETTHQFWMMAVIDLIIGTPEYESNRVVSTSARFRPEDA